MNRDKKSISTRSKSIVLWSRKLFIWGSIIMIGISFIGCKKERLNDYYVKYEVNSSTIYVGGKLDATINTENNNSTTIRINKRARWETVIGPVKNGFNASMRVTSPTETYNKLKLYTNIYVSKNGSPFALKKSDGSDSPRDAVNINYTIDY